jgi:hypothetical protein
MPDGVVVSTEEGAPQGGPLSPLLSNIVLDELDHELERRGHRFVRYADDLSIYVKSERAGQRVFESVTRFLERRMKLVVNRQKSAVSRPRGRHILGFSIRPNMRKKAGGAGHFEEDQAASAQADSGTDSPKLRAVAPSSNSAHQRLSAWMG